MTSVFRICRLNEKCKTLALPPMDTCSWNVSMRTIVLHFVTKDDVPFRFSVFSGLLLHPFLISSLVSISGMRFQYFALRFGGLKNCDFGSVSVFSSQRQRLSVQMNGLGFLKTETELHFWLPHTTCIYIFTLSFSLPHYSIHHRSKLTELFNISWLAVSLFTTMSPWTHT